MSEDNKPAEEALNGEAKKAPGRPRKSPAKPKPAAAAAPVQPKDTATEDGEKKSAPKEKHEGAPAGIIIPEGEEVNIDTREENGALVASDNVYLKKRLPNSKRYTYVLLAVKGLKV